MHMHRPKTLVISPLFRFGKYIGMERNDLQALTPRQMPSNCELQSLQIQTRHKERKLIKP